ncbi:MAG TPA: hypothetical protein VK028_05715 [Micromonosporaceae bacterium]|nr:hypothetical protein [Micromonosporaceae bacterium]
MSYTVETPSGKQQPGTVKAASALLYAGAGLIAIYCVLSVILANATSNITIEGQSAPGFTGAFSAVVNIVILAPLAVGLGVLGVLVGRGKNTARIVTWVIDGIVVLCCGCNLLGQAFTSSLMSSLGEAYTEALEQVEAATPAWLSVSITVVSLLILGTQIAVIILLAVPSANEFFRKEEQVWVPPAAGAQPPFPPAPGTTSPGAWSPPSGGATPPSTGPATPPPSGPTPPDQPPSSSPPPPSS